MGFSINIAILGDLHGHFTLAYRLLKRWERENREAIELILQVGDLGVWPNTYRVDKATMRFAEKDPDELSFRDYYESSPEADEILGQDASEERKISADLYFIKGNHEDFEFLESLRQQGENPASVDFYRKMFYLRSGNTYNIRVGKIYLRVGVLGGIAFKGGSAEKPASCYYQKWEVRKIIGNTREMDILLTHDIPFNTLFENIGSKDVLEVIESRQPRFHFCGHYHEQGQEILAAGKTKSFMLNEVNFRGARKLNPGCIGILRWSDGPESDFCFMDEVWVKEYNRFNFRSLRRS